MSQVVINYSTPKYFSGQNRLMESINNNSCHQLIGYMATNLICPTHDKYMYAFKPYSFIDSYSFGYSTILWLDASMYVIKDLTPIFEQIERDGYFFQDSGWTNERWTPPHVKEYFGTDEGVMLSSGVLGLDLTSEIGGEFLRQWKQASDDGMFNGSHDNHRHDQTCASLIAYKLGMKLTDNNTFWQYGEIDKPMHDGILIIANGIC